MNCVNTLFSQCLLLLLLLIPVGSSLAEDEFSFDLEEIEKKNLSWGGYAELNWEHMDINQGSAFSLLNLADEPLSAMDRLGASVQLDGSYTLGISSVRWLLKAIGQQDNMGWSDTADIYEAYVNIKPSPLVSTSLGKKSYQWGKGYAWNPVGVINRRKDPNNPEESREGYITAEADLIKSGGSGMLQTTALTSVLLPVWDGVNEDFGRKNSLNLAGKLYLLLLDTDIDLLFLAGDNRAPVYGLDFSRNMATNFEIHGEMAWRNDQEKVRLTADNSLRLEREDVLNWLLGIRYLSSSDITTIIEYYHNDSGYTEEEMSGFFQFARDGGEDFQQTANRSLLNQARTMSLKGYGRPNPGRNYLYVRFNQKEPFDILYFTPALTTIVNVDDESFTLTPELSYTGFTNWEIRLRFSYLNGGDLSEYGEKQNSNKLDLRIRYFF